MSDAQSRRDTISAAFDAHSGDGAEPAPVEPVAAEPVEPAPEPKEAPTGERNIDEPAKVAKTVTPTPRGEGGKFQKRTVVTPTPKNGAPTPTRPPAPGVTTSTPPPPLKPPANWRPEAREKWGTLPREVQEETLRVQQEVRRGMEQAAEARKQWDNFQSVTAPYAGMIAAEGATPTQAAESLFRTAAALRTGSSTYKAQLIAQMVSQYLPGHEGIALLDAALSGQPAPAQQQRQAETAQYRDPRVDQLLAQLQQTNQGRTKSMMESAHQKLEEFRQGAEFIADVQDDMADLMEFAEKRGIDLSYEDAYNRAVALHPEISKVLKQREAAKQATAVQASTQRIRAASSSLKTQPGGVSTATAPKSRRDTIAAAFDQHE